MALDVPVIELDTWICLSESEIKCQYKEIVNFKGGGDIYKVQDTQSLTEKDSRPSDLLLVCSCFEEGMVEWYLQRCLPS